MRQMASILWKDLRGLRWELAGWIALNAVFAATWPALAATGNVRSYLFVPFFSGIPVLVGACGTLLAIRIVQADPLVGTTATWRTRPLSRLSWLAAKLLLVAVVVVAIPSLAEALLALSLGMRVQDVVVVAVIGAAWWAVWAAPGMAVGAIAPSFARAFLVAIGAVALMALFRTQVSPALERVALPLGWSSSLAQSQILMSSLVMVGGALTVVIHQVLSLRVIRSCVLATIALLCFLVVADAWQWDVARALPSRREFAVDPAVIDPDRVTVELEPGPGREWSAYPHRNSPAVITKAADVVSAHGLPDGVWVEAVARDEHLQLGAR